MATTFDSIPAAQKADFLKRLEIYGLGESSILQADLVVPAKTTMTLSSAAHSFVRPHMLSTTDLNELKKWIGIPDQRFKEGLRSAFAKTRLSVPKRSAAAPQKQGAKPAAHAEDIAAPRAFNSADYNDIRIGAMSYIWGDSAHVTEFKVVVEEALGRFSVAVWPFLTITVHTGAVLELGAGANVLCAWKIIIQEGGEVRGLNTTMNVQCTILQKEQIFLRPGVTTKVQTRAAQKK